MNEELSDFFKRYQQEYSATARLEFYLETALARKETATDSEAVLIRTLEQNIQTAEQAIAKGDLDLFTQAFERTIRRTVELNLPEYDKVHLHEVRSKAGAKGGKMGKNKHRHFYTMLTEICKEIGSTNNKDVLHYWRRFDNRDAHKGAAEGSARETFQLWADWSGATTRKRQNREMSSDADSDEAPERRRKDTEFNYYYFDNTKKTERTASLQQIRNVMLRIRKSGFQHGR